MNSTTQAIHNYFVKLGLPAEVTTLYLALRTEGPQSISELSRNAKIERTRIYRLLDTLQSSGLIETELRYKRTVLRAAPITNLEILVTKKEQDVRDMQDELAQLHDSLAGSHLTSPTTRVQTYEGSDGLKQMFWNQTRARTESVSILFENMQSRTNLTFFERWAQLCNERGLRSRSIIGDHFIATQQEWYSRHSNDRLKDWKARYIAADVFPITYSTIIYDDVTAYFTWKDNEIFGVEIYNQQIADAQRYFFEMLWGQGKQIDDLKFQLISDTK